jgi:hypothetical protein
MNDVEKFSPHLQLPALRPVFILPKPFKELPYTHAPSQFCVTLNNITTLITVLLDEIFGIPSQSKPR